MAVATVDYEITGNIATFAVYGVPMTDEGREKAEALAAEDAETFCRQWACTDTAGEDTYWIVQWEIN